VYCISNFIAVFNQIHSFNLILWNGGLRLVLKLNVAECNGFQTAKGIFSLILVKLAETKSC